MTSRTSKERDVIMSTTNIILCVLTVVVCLFVFTTSFVLLELREMVYMVNTQLDAIYVVIDQLAYDLHFDGWVYDEEKNLENFN